MKTAKAERIFCSIWHLLLALMGIIEFKAHRSRLMKVLAFFFALFHVDATVNDWRGTETCFKRGLRCVTGNR